MNITNVPQSMIVTRDGVISSSWRIWFNQITNQLQEFLSDERYRLPSQNENNIPSLENMEKNQGGLLYNTSLNTAQVNIKNRYLAATEEVEYRFKTIFTYEEMTSTRLGQIPSGERNGRIIYETDTTITRLGTGDTFVTL